jgi:hypothetical protein
MEFIYISRKVITDSDYKVNSSQANARLVSITLFKNLSNSIYIYIYTILASALSCFNWA